MTPEHLLSTVTDRGKTLAFSEARDLMHALLAGDLTQQQIASLLTALHHRGETAAELAGFAEAMCAASTHLPLTDAERDRIVDTCGTGGDGSGTFNISTAVALVAAAAGVPVAKHGNRGITSRCGSADVLEALGIPIEHTPDSAAEFLRRHNFAFLLAPRFHPAIKLVTPVRRALPFRTVFNLLGPMTNPAGARRQVIGVYSAQAVPLVAEALATGGRMRQAMVVHGSGMDELSLAGESTVAVVQGTGRRSLPVVPEDAGVDRSNDALRGGDAVENAAILRRIFSGERGPARDMVRLNAAAVLQIAGVVSSLRQGSEQAAEAIDSGAVTRLLQRLQGN